MRTILIATEKPFAKEAIQRIQAEINVNEGFELKLLERYENEQELINAIKDVDALIIRSDKINGNVMEAAKNLKIIVRAGAGVDNVDLDEASKNEIVVMNTPGQNANAVAELAFGLMLGLIRHKYNGMPGTELKDKKIALHGFGNIGRRLSLIAKGFGMQVFAYDPFIAQAEIGNYGVLSCSTLEELYRVGDFITINIPATSETAGIINYELLSKTKKNAFLVNTARKELVDEEGLKRILEERPKYMYASDVAPSCKEELEKSFPDQTLFTTKKMGAQTAEANINAGIAAVKQIIRFFNMGDHTFKVN